MIGREGPLWWFEENHYQLEQLEPERFGERGDAFDALGQPLRPYVRSKCACGRGKFKDETQCIACREPERVAAMRANPIDPKALDEIDNEIVRPYRRTPQWRDPEEVIREVRAEIEARRQITREAAE